MDRYAMIIDLGNELPPIDERFKTPDHLIEGCQSRVCGSTQSFRTAKCNPPPTPTPS